MFQSLIPPPADAGGEKKGNLHKIEDSHYLKKDYFIRTCPACPMKSLFFYFIGVKCEAYFIRIYPPLF